MKILVADDDAVSRCLMERILHRAGYDVVLAEDGPEALKILGSPGGPRLALVDWMMPGLDGPSVCLEVRSSRERPYSYIILLTSKGSKEDLVAGLEAGADDYLTKPCNAEELKARLRTGERVLRLEDTLVQAREEMRFKATHDALTSLWNRGAILALMEDEIRRVERERTYSSLLLCDVDHFKRINDAHGHLMGDAVLREVAVRLGSATRPGDAVGRYGGEEFLIILGDCGPEGLMRRAEEIRKAIVFPPFAGIPQALSVSISIGAITIDHHTSQTPEACLSQMDAALYRAKLEGRDRIVIVEQESTAKIAAGSTPQAASVPASAKDRGLPWLG